MGTAILQGEELGENVCSLVVRFLRNLYAAFKCFEPVHMEASQPTYSGAARIFHWRGKTGWGAENFSCTTLSTLAVNATNAPFMD